MRRMYSERLDQLVDGGEQTPSAPAQPSSETPERYKSFTFIPLTVSGFITIWALQQNTLPRLISGEGNEYSPACDTWNRL